VTRPAAPKPEDRRQTHQSLDLAPGRRGGVCRGHHPPSGQRRGYSARAAAPRGQLATCQTLDHQSRPGICQENKQRDRLIRLAPQHPTWVLGFGDEVWWSRLAPPQLHSWRPTARGLRLVEKALPRGDPDPKALACYGLLLRATPTTPEQLWRRFAAGQPVSGLTTQFLAWGCDKLAALGKEALRLIWDNASWHKSREVRRWIRAHNRLVKEQRQGVRLVPCRLPSKSPWLNPIEPKWVHGKRAVVEPERLLSARELEARICAY
jgi:transposase